MKRKLLIVSHALELGGAERSLIGLLDAIDPEIWDVDLFLLRHEGELMEAIPDRINLLPVIPAYTVLARPMVTTIREGHLLLTGARLLGKIAAHIYNKAHGYAVSDVSLEYSHKFTCPLMPDIAPDVEYDLAISFLTPHYFVARKVRAEKKAAWIHTDYSKINVNVPSENAMWGSFDHIVSISESVTEGFCNKFRNLRNRIIEIRNILAQTHVLTQSRMFSAEDEMPQSETRLLSVGRFCEAKNFDNVPAICAKLVAMGLNVKWYLIGFGSDEGLIRKKISEVGMEQRVIVLGKKENPYPYMAACDLYVQPSRFEGNSVTVREAQMLAKPVVITRYATSASQLEDGTDGVIVPMDNEGCAEGIAALLRSRDEMERLSSNCRQRDYSNSEEARKLLELL